MPLTLRTRLVAGAGVVAGICVIASVGLGIVLANAALHPPRRALRPNADALARNRIAPVHGQMEEVTLTTADGIALRAWFFSPPPDAWNGHSVIALHGVSDNRESTVPTAAMLVAHGYRVLTPDARASGSSEGVFAAYGVIERDDIREWSCWLRERQPGGCIHGLGGSMGAAQLLQAIGEPRVFCDAVAESSFANFQEVAFDRVGQQFGVGPWLGRTLLRPAVDVGFLVARLQTHVDLRDANPTQTLRETRTPVLLIDDLADRNMPRRHAQALVRSNPEFVQLWEVPSAPHVGAANTARAEYVSRVLTFFASHELRLPDAARGTRGDLQCCGAGQRPAGEDQPAGVAAGAR